MDRSRRGDPSMRQLRLFLALAEELHFGNAARREFLSQSALSQQIKALEQRLGATLVQRDNHSVTLTHAGETLRPSIEALIDSVEQLQRLADSCGRQVSGRLVLGTVGGEGALPAAIATLAELRARHPDIEVESRNLGLGSQFHDVLSGNVDAAFLVHPVPLSLQTLDLATSPRVAIMPADDPLAAADAGPVTLTQLRDRPFLNVPPEAGRYWWDGWSMNPRPDGSAVIYGPAVDDIESMLLAVARGLGIVFLPAAAREFYPWPGVTYVDVVDLPDYTSALAWAPKNRSLPVVAALRAAARAATFGS